MRKIWPNGSRRGSMDRYRNSSSLYERALSVIPGGVNSPVRAFGSVGRNPVFIKKGEGSKIWDEDGNIYIDYIGSWGPLILGHSHPVVLDAVLKVLSDGSSFGLPTRKEVELAELVTSCVPSMEKVRLTSSGTEACMAAVRLARAFTGRNTVVKFAGCYHGHSDSLLVKAGSGALTYGTPDSNGVTAGTVADTVTFEYNDTDNIRRYFSENGKMTACVIVEPVAANMGVVLPEKDFLSELRDITSANGSLLIFDEVITGFRLGLSGAQGLYGVNPDLTILGKIIGGGYPVGAFGGRKDIMDLVSPKGGVYHAGTLSGNPVSVQAGLAVIGYLKSNPDIYSELESNTTLLVKGFEDLAIKSGLKPSISHIGSLFTVFFLDKVPGSLKEASNADCEKFKVYFTSMLDNGIMMPPSQFEANFVSTAHTKGDLEATLISAEKCFERISE
jgi:glutamate-1-semialdehyde 2,1-aminomutase